MSLALRLAVSKDCTDDDFSCYISSNTFRHHDIWYGDEVLVQSDDGNSLYSCYITYNKEKIASVSPSGIILSRTCLRKLSIQTGQKIILHIQIGKRRPSLPSLHCTFHCTNQAQEQKTDHQLFAELDVVLKNYFHDQYRPVVEGQKIGLDGIELWIYPRGAYRYGMVTNNTRFEFMRAGARCKETEEIMTVIKMKKESSRS